MKPSQEVIIYLKHYLSRRPPIKMDNDNSTSTLSFTLGSPALRDGYDLPVYGLDNGQFYSLHVPALTCILPSLISAILAITLSFRKTPKRAFVDWTKSGRFVVYMAICDGAFNLAHSMDHLHITITKSPQPRFASSTESCCWSSS